MMSLPKKNKRTALFIIAEAGSNWKAGSPVADWCRARSLVDAARDAGADAVKFQTFRADSVYVPNAGSSDYLSKNGFRGSIFDLFKKMAMPYEMIPKLAAYCRKRNIEFMSSFFSEEDFRRVDPWVRRHKIASYEITHPRFLELAARSGKPLILSTGAATYEDIDWAVAYFRKAGGKDLTLLQCTAKYPASFQALNLRVIPEFFKRYKTATGLSDHSPDPLVGPVTATALGAVVIEKHFTLSRKLKGPDHAFALEPDELKQMVRAVRDCQRSLGDGKKRVLPEERELRSYAQRAVQVTRKVAKAETLRFGHNIDILRPGRQTKGLHPRHLKRIDGARTLRALALGRGVLQRDFKKK